MFAFVDESGNTGAHFLDESQPVFYMGALATPQDFDLEHGDKVGGIARRLGVKELHGAELGTRGVEAIGTELSTLLRSTPHAFYLSRVVKRDLVAMKFFDTVFDPSDNPAASRHTYYNDVLRTRLLVEFWAVLDTATLQAFWEVLDSRGKKMADGRLALACKAALARLPQVKEIRPRQLLHDALSWASRNPDALTFYALDKVVLAQHLPNVAGFPTFLWWLHDTAHLWRKAVTEIRHDEQAQFGKALSSFHESLSNASPDARVGFGSSNRRWQAVPGSQLTMLSSDRSPGIQVVDVLTWFARRRERTKGSGLGGTCLQSLIARGHFHELSVEMTVRRAAQEFAAISAQPLTQSMLDAGQRIISQDDCRRAAALELDTDRQAE